MVKSVHRPAGRPPLSGERMPQISVRLTPSEIQAADTLAKWLSERGGSTVSRNEAIRTIYNEGLDRMKRRGELG